MSSPIKPPGKPGAGAVPEGGPEKASESFQKALDETAKTSAAADPNKAAAQDAMSTLASEVAAGRIDVRAAVDQLVSRALESSSATALPPARRAELEAHLRRALADDPTLRALTEDLESGG